MSISLRDPDAMARFMDKIIMQPNGCWIWTANRHRQGYGYFYFQGKSVRANRWILQEHLGRPLRPGYCACHICDTPPCVNPAHLFEGTYQDNNDDMTRKGRGRTRRGAEHYLAKLSIEKAKRIRRQYATGKFTQRELGRMYGVSQSQISEAVRGKTWTNDDRAVA